MVGIKCCLNPLSIPFAFCREDLAYRFYRHFRAAEKIENPARVHAVRTGVEPAGPARVGFRVRHLPDGNAGDLGNGKEFFKHKPGVFRLMILGHLRLAARIAHAVIGLDPRFADDNRPVVLVFAAIIFDHVHMTAADALAHLLVGAGNRRVRIPAGIGIVGDDVGFDVA